MALEDRGVDIDTFLALQEKAKEDIYSSHDSLKDFLELLKGYNPGEKFHLAFILEQLVKLEQLAKTEPDSKDGSSKKAIKSAFFDRLLCYLMHHALRGIKFKARIRVPTSYQLVGVADEGRAYINEGIKEDDVFTLKANHIYGTFLHLLSDLLNSHAYHDNYRSLYPRA
jgi:RNA-dependent RNA polymerase